VRTLLALAVLGLVIRSPKHQEQVESLGRPMKVSARLTFVPLPTFSITNIAASNGTITLSWSPGTNSSAYTVWCSTNSTGPWTVLVSPVTNTFLSFPITQPNCFYRIEQPPTNTITILDDDRFGVAATHVYWAAAWIETLTFGTNDCAVAEGCAEPGPRKLLRFPVTVWNPNNANYWYGPSGPYYFYDPCHHHFHLTNFSKFTLIGDTAQVTSRKMGWCVINFGKVLDLGWNTDPQPGSCNSPNLMPGWGDAYNVQPCMWFDITGLSDGVYTMKIELDPTKAYGFYTMSQHRIAITNTVITPL